MSGVATAIIVTGAATAYYQSEAQKKAAEKAARAQTAATDAAAAVQLEYLDFEKEKYADYMEQYEATRLYSQAEYDEAKAEYERLQAETGIYEGRGDRWRKGEPVKFPGTLSAVGEEEDIQAKLDAAREKLEAMEGRVSDEYRDIYERSAGEKREALYEETKQYAEQVFEQQKELLAPYVEGGETAFMRQQAISGLAGAKAQAQEIELIQSSPGFYEMIAEGESAILANASATGGVRGGDTQSFLAQYRPQMLRQEMQDKYNMYSGIASTGLAAAGMQSAAAGDMANAQQAAASIAAGGTGTTGTAGYNTSGIGTATANLASTLAQSGQNQASYELAQGAIEANQYSWIPQTVGFLSAYGPSSSNPSYLQTMLGSSSTGSTYSTWP